MIKVGGEGQRPFSLHKMLAQNVFCQCYKKKMPCGNPPPLSQNNFMFTPTLELPTDQKWKNPKARLSCSCLWTEELRVHRNIRHPPVSIGPEQRLQDGHGPRPVEGGEGRGGHCREGGGQGPPQWRRHLRRETAAQSPRWEDAIGGHTRIGEYRIK